MGSMAIGMVVGSMAIGMVVGSMAVSLVWLDPIPPASM